MGNSRTATNCKMCGSTVIDDVRCLATPECEIANLRDQLRQAQEERDNYHASWEGAKIRASLAEQAADAAIEELLVAKRNAESWQETAQQAQESLKRELKERAEVYNNHVIACKTERDAAIEREGEQRRRRIEAEALVDRIDKIIAAPNERPAATAGYLAWAGLLTDVRLEIHKARKSAPAEAQGRQAR